MTLTGVGHSCRKALWDTLVGHSCGTLLRDTFVEHSCRALLSSTLARHSCAPLLRNTLVRHPCGSLFWDTQIPLWDTLAKHSCRTLLSDILVRHSCGDTLQAAGGGHRHVSKTSVSFETHSQVTRQVCKTSISYETSPKIDSSLQNKRREFLKNSHFKSAKRAHLRDFLENSRVKVSKTSISYKTSSKSQAGSLIGAHTLSSPAKQFRYSHPLQHTTRQSQCHSDIHLQHNLQPHDSACLPRKFARPHQHTHKVLCLPRNVTAATPHNLTIPYKVLRLPRKVKSYNIISYELHQNLHHRNDFDTF